MSASDVKIKFLAYNLWSNEHVAVYRRMHSISDLIASNDPDVIFLQLTKLHAGDDRCDIMPEPWLRPPGDPAGLLSAFLDWKRPTDTDRDAVKDRKKKNRRLHPMCCDCEHRLHAATCRFPGPTQSDIRSVDRIGRAHEYFRHFANCSDHNAVLAGDMSLDDDLDGPFPIPAGSGWVDAWCELRASDVAGWTYDSVANPMLRGFKPGLTRPDRFLCKLRDFDLYSIEMVGTEAIRGVTYYDDNGDLLPVLPSHPFGLLLTISSKQA
ncbi:uncharacterized protein [Aegilops tauschii subsp. strangulata]|uniref:uncharacterized protein n=1 Tax=Aegilops tauschii subsp. strangulata TaxID=200361 RepID=UPI00098BBADA|nr:uncharacterized protein LOC109759254 [Aegilops tauschii subsp. strangulata]